MMNELDKEMAGIGKMVERDCFIKLSAPSRHSHGTMYTCDGAQIFSAYELKDNLFLRMGFGMIEFDCNEYHERLGPHNARIYLQSEYIKNYRVADWGQLIGLSPAMEHLENRVEFAVQRGAFALESKDNAVRTLMREIKDIGKEIGRLV